MVLYTIVIFFCDKKIDTSIFNKLIMPDSVKDSYFKIAMFVPASEDQHHHSTQKLYSDILNVDIVIANEYLTTYSSHTCSTFNYRDNGALRNGIVSWFSDLNDSYFIECASNYDTSIMCVSTLHINHLKEKLTSDIVALRESNTVDNNHNRISHINSELPVHIICMFVKPEDDHYGIETLSKLATIHYIDPSEKFDREDFFNSIK